MTRAQAWRRWQERSGTERLDISIRWPLYLTSASEPLLALLVVVGQKDVRWPGAVVFLLVSGLHAVVCLALLRSGLAAYLGGPRPEPRLVAATVGLAVAGVLAAMAAFPGFVRPTAAGALAVSLVVMMIMIGALAASLAPLLRAPALVAIVLAGAILAAGVGEAVGGGGPPDSSPAGAVAFYASTVGGIVLSYRFSVWMLGVMREMDRSRVAHASLAVAEERLRFARDLHDVLGRNLSLVAVQSELAARLAQRGDGTAVERMLEVRQVAHDSLREMRAVVGGYRTADLDSELAGARSVLRAAGVTCRVTGDGTSLPSTVQTALGWVVREATTNVIRHSDATVCRIDLEIADGPGTSRLAMLRMSNDGAPPRDIGEVGGAKVGGGGTGLAGLGERLAELGGTLDAARQRGGRFVVTARLPATVEATDAEPTPPNSTPLTPAPPTPAPPAPAPPAPAPTMAPATPRTEADATS